jgi:hypothetical protein
MSPEDAFGVLDKEVDVHRLDQNIISALKTYWMKTQGESHDFWKEKHNENIERAETMENFLLSIEMRFQEI